MFCHFSKLSKDFPHSITISKSSLWSPKAFIQTSVLTSFLNYSSLPYQCINTHLSAVHQTHQMSSSVKHGTAVYFAKIPRKSHPHFFMTCSLKPLLKCNLVRITSSGSHVHWPCAHSVLCLVWLSFVFKGSKSTWHNLSAVCHSLLECKLHVTNECSIHHCSLTW